MFFCTSCGGKLEDGTRFCEFCGAPQIEVGGAAEPKPQKPTRAVSTAPADNKPAGKGATIAIIGLVAAIVVTAGVFIALYFVIGNKDDTSSEAVATQESADSKDKSKSESSSAKKESDNEAMDKKSSSSSSKESATEGIADDKDYIIADSDSKTLTDSDLSGLSAQELAIARNEIYARHGRAFLTQALQEYFDGKDWYTKNPNYSDSMLSDVEKLNAGTISDYEKAHGGQYKWE